MTINTSVSPYFDDFDEGKGFQQVLFKPGYAVQARELTQLQSILKDQIAKFGDHIFQNGSVVIPGNSFSDLNTPYIKVSQFSGTAALSDFDGKVVIGSVSGVRAHIKKVVPSTTTDPVTFYVSYLSGGGSSATYNEYQANEVLSVEGFSYITATLASTAPIGVGSMAFVNRGVYYVNGSFVGVDSQSIVISKYTALPSCHVMLKIVDSIINSDTDSTLLDPAQGSYNYAAPGADRIKTVLELVSIPIDSVVSSDYIELMRYRVGVLEEHAKYAKYSELEKTIARRTFDESGNYIVSGLRPKLREHKRTQFNNGVYTNGDSSKFVLEVSPGKSYIGGFEIDKLSPTSLDIDKARTPDHIKEKKVSLQSLYGQFLYVSVLKSLPNFVEHQIIDLHSSSDPLNVSSVKIGEARVVGIDYMSGDPSSPTAIYKLFFHDLEMIGTNQVSDIGGFRFDAAGSGIVLSKLFVPLASSDYSIGEIVSNISNSATCIVKTYSRATGSMFVCRNDITKPIPSVGDFVTGDSVSAPSSTVKGIESLVSVGALPVFNIPTSSIYSTRGASLSYDTAYTAWKTIVINTNASGDGSYTITSGTLAYPEVGVTVAVGSTGIVEIDKLSVTSNTTFIITGGPANDRVVILTQVHKTLAQPRVKTLTPHTLANVVPSATISLGKADVYKITSIFSGGADVTSKFLLNSGQTDFYYGVSYITCQSSLPTSNLTINFDYFVHSGTGDYFSVDSYTTLGVDYIGRVPLYRSNTTSIIYDLSDVFDFRPRVGDDSTFTSGSAVVNDTPVISTILNSSVQYYVPRVDVVSISLDKKISVTRGTPNTTPAKPSLAGGSVELYTLKIPAYTPTLDSIIINNAKNRRFTMEDINKLQDRVATVEYFSTLNSIETSLLTYEVIDANTGLNRFKTGYLVDNFDNPFSVCDFYNPHNIVDFRYRRVSASMEAHTASMSLMSTSTNYIVRNGQVTLPYTQVPFISQGTSTRITNLNPYLVFSWEGNMTISPPGDSWTQTEYLPDIINNITETINVTREERVEVPTEYTPPDYGGGVDTEVDPGPTPEPPPVEMSSISVFARDVGLTNLAFDAVISIPAPTSVVNSFNNTASAMLVDPAMNHADWETLIALQAEIYNAYAGSSLTSSSIYDGLSGLQISVNSQEY